MASTKVLCLVQQKKIGLYTSLIILSFIIVVFVKATIVARNVITQQTILQKKSEIGLKRSEITKLKKATQFIEQEKVDEQLQRENCYYYSFDKQKFIDDIITKMNQEDFDTLSLENEKHKNVEYGGFLLRLDANGNDGINKIIEKLKQKMIVVDNQDIQVSLESNVVRVDFQADYEYVAYRVLKMMKQLLPGYVVVRSVSVQPVRDDVRRALYDRKFNGQNFNDKVIDFDGRLNCTIELEWIYLSTVEKSANSVAK